MVDGAYPALESKGYLGKVREKHIPLCPGAGYSHIFNLHCVSDTYSNYVNVGTLRLDRLMAVLMRL